MASRGLYVVLSMLLVTIYQNSTYNSLRITKDCNGQPCKVDDLADSYEIPCAPCQLFESKRKLVMLSATRLQPSGVQHFTASPSTQHDDRIVLSQPPFSRFRLLPLYMVSCMPFEHLRYKVVTYSSHDNIYTQLNLQKYKIIHFYFT